MTHKLDKTAGMLHKIKLKGHYVLRGLSKEGWGEGKWGIRGCHSECINSNKWGYKIKFVEQCYLTKGFLVFLI